jgi:uncharacterized protein YjbI with pentapeptide repeats
MPDTPAAPRPPRIPPELPTAAHAPDRESSVEGVELAALDLAGSSLELVDLQRCRVSDAKLAGSRWRRCTLHDCDLVCSDLANVVLEHTGLRRVRITGARLTGFALGTSQQWDVAVRDCQAELSAWRHARLERASFSGCRLARSDWAGATLSDVVFEDCDLGGADFSQCRMRSVLFRGCRYDGIRGLGGLRGATVHVDDLLELQVAMAHELGIRVTAGASA